MSRYFEMAFALANDSLSLFLGTGFSKHITDGRMPDWYTLLADLCKYLKDAKYAKECLDKTREAGFSLEDCAQVLELMFIREAKDFKKHVAHHLSKLKASASAKTAKQFLEQHCNVKIITTNYDTLIETQLLPDDCNSHCPGRPIAKREGKLNIYHIHGSIDDPRSLIATTRDYYQFMDRPNYYSHKMYTLMHENTVIILGYSLSDLNLRAIISSHKENSLSLMASQSVFLVSRKEVPRHIRDYYEASYGIRVIDRTTIDEVFEGIDDEYAEAKKYVKEGERYLQKVLHECHTWKDEYLRTRASLFHILAVAESTAQDIYGAKFQAMLISILKKKRDFTDVASAWDQYADLAEWLVFLGSVCRVQGTRLESTYLELVAYSMRHMSGTHAWGKSWEAFNIWLNKWQNITFENRILVEAYLESNPLSSDIEQVIKR